MEEDDSQPDLITFLSKNWATCVFDKVKDLLSLSNLDQEIPERTISELKRRLERLGLTLHETDRKEFAEARRPIGNIFDSVVVHAAADTRKIQLEKCSEEIVLYCLRATLADFKIKHGSLSGNTKFNEIFAGANSQLDDLLALTLKKYINDYFAYTPGLGKIYDIIRKEESTVGDLIEYLQSLGRPTKVKV